MMFIGVGRNDMGATVMKRNDMYKLPEDKMSKKHKRRKRIKSWRKNPNIRRCS